MLFFNPRLGHVPKTPHHGTQINHENDINSMLDEDDEYDGSDIALVNNPENTEKPSKPIDPFEMRINEEQMISKHLLAVLKRHARQARKELQIAK
ncbi:hypothetical protein EV179_003170 [Coemansia sp. RSA 487]|nr:hypothetical protein EV179_003170 [Coemansia sp. RSA 487]